MAGNGVFVKGRTYCFLGNKSHSSPVERNK